jgi:hypothetical protein
MYGWFVNANAQVADGALKLSLSGRNNPLRVFSALSDEQPEAFEMNEPYRLSFDVRDGACSSRCALRIFFNIRQNASGNYVANIMSYYPIASFGRGFGQATLFGYFNDDPNRFGEIRDNPRTERVSIFDGQTHTVSLVVDSGVTTLYIDDRLINTVNYPLDIRGSIGLGVERVNEDTSVSLSFDNVKLTTLADAETFVEAVDPAVFTDIATSLNFEFSIPIPAGWTFGNLNPFRFFTVSPSNQPEQEVAVVVETNRSLIGDVRNEQDFARQFFRNNGSTRLREFTFVNVSGERLYKADLIQEGEVRGAAFVRKVQNNYFLGIIVVSYSEEVWRANERMIYTMIARSGLATPE